MKKIISAMLTLAMVCSFLVTVPVTVSAKATITDGQNTTALEFTNVAMLLGEDITQRNFTWFSTDSGEGKITYEKIDDLVDGDFSENAMVVTATRDTRYGEQSHKPGYYQNEAVMTELEPGETYVYRFSNGSTKSEMYTITIGNDDSSFSFAYGGDAQVGGMDNGTYEDEVEAWGRTLRQITTAEEFEGIEFFMSGGDQIESGSSVEEIEAQYDIYLNHDEFKSLPQAVVLGNHDNKPKGTHSHHFNQPNLDPDYGATYHWQDTTKFNSANYYFVYNSMLVIGLNLNTFDDNNVGTAEKEARDRASAEEHAAFIQKVLDETKDNKDILWTVVLTHQSPYGSSYHGNYKYDKDADGNPILNDEGYYVYSIRPEQYYYINIRKYLLPYLYEAGVDLVLSGHDHSYTRTHIIKPIYDRATDTFTDSSEITPYASNSYTYADGTTTPSFNQNWTDANGINWPNQQVTSKPVKVTNPDGLMWVTGASSSGSQVNNAEYHNPYAAVIGKADTRHVAKFDVTPNSLSMKVYNLGNNKTDNITLFDEFTIERTTDVKVGGVSLDENATVAVGKTKALVPKFSPAEPTNTNVMWKSDNEAVAKVENGIVTGVKAGTANITVTTEDGGYTANCKVTVVEDVPVSAINIPSSMNMMIGETKTISAVVAPENAVTKDIAWTTSDENIATVSANGSVKAIRHGEVIITATATDGSGVSASCVVNIGYIASERVLSETSLTMDVMDTAKLSVTQTPADASYTNLVWQSSNPDIIEVDQKGNLKAWGQGTAVISVVNEEGSVDCTVTSLGKTTFLQDYEDENYTILMSGSGADERFWNRVQEEDGNWVMEVNGKNYDEKSKVGSVYTNQLNTETTTDKVWTPVMKNGYVLDLDVKRMTEEGHQALNIRTYDENATKIAYMVKLTSMEVGEWYDVKILIKTDGIEAYYKKWSEDTWKTDKYWNGVVWKTGKTISGKSLANFMAICPYRLDTDLTLEEAQKTQIRFDNIRISSPVAATGLTLEETSGSLDINETKQLKPVFTPDNVTDDHMIYTSSNPDVATVDKNGVVKARMTGDAVITAKAVESGLTAEYAVDVYSSIKVEDVIVPQTLEMLMGDTKQITATVVPETAAGGVVWTSSNEELATVDENGNITAYKHGEVDIVATAVDGSGKNGVCHVTIGYIPSVRTLNHTSLELDLFRTEQLILTFDNENASYKEITWSSSDAGVASVDENGLVTANGNGTAIISATTGEGSVECTVVVNGGVTYFNGFDDADNKEFIDGSIWTRVQEEDGNWVLDMSGTNLTSASNHLTGADSGVGVIPYPAIEGGFVIDFDIKRMTTAGHQAINLRIGTTKNYYRKINLDKLDLNEWYDMKLYYKGEEVTLFWKKASESAWQSSSDWWSGKSPLGNASAAISSAIKKDSLIIYPYVVKTSDDKTLENARKTHIRMDNIKITSPVSATGFGIAENNINLAAGENAVLTNVFTPGNATDTHITYVSSDVNVATVDKYGKVTAIGNGNAVITATAADGGFVDTVNVTVGAVVPELSVKKEITESGFKFIVTSNVALDAAKVYVAAYEASGRMLGAGSENYIADGTEIPVNVSNAAYFKVLAWDASAKAVVDAIVVY